MIYDLKDQAMLDRIVEIVESQENQDRIEKHLTDYQIANGNQNYHVKLSLQKRYPESWDMMTIIDLAIARKIIRKLSRVYSQGVKREVVDINSGVVNEELTNLLNYIYNDIDENNESYDYVMQKANEFVTNHEYVEDFTYLDEKNRIRIKSLPQHLFTALPNKTKTKSEVIIFKQDLADLTDYHKFIDWDNYPEEIENDEVLGIYTIWSKDYHFTFARIRGERINDQTNETEIVFTNVMMKENNANKKNPYGIHPFVAIKKSTEGHFYPYGTEISEMSKEICIVLSDLCTIAKEQGFGQAVIYFDGEKPPAITKTGPTHVINVPNKLGNSKFEFANANPDLKGHLDIALSLIRLLLTTNDLTTDKVSGELSATNFASAIDRLIADSETIYNIEDQRKKYIVAEQNQFKVIMYFLKYLEITKSTPEDYPKVKISNLNADKFKVQVSFNSIKPLTTEKEKAQTINYLEESGLILPFEKHMRFNEKLSEKEAMKREEEIKEAKKDKMQDFMDGEILKANREIDNARQGISENKPTGINQAGQGKHQESQVPERERQEEIRQRNSKANKR